MAGAFVGGRVVDGVWVGVGGREERSEGPSLVRPEAGMNAAVVVTSSAKGRGMGGLWSPVLRGWKHRGAWKDARQPSSQWLTLLATSFALGQVLAYTLDPPVTRLGARRPGAPAGARAAHLLGGPVGPVVGVCELAPSAHGCSESRPWASTRPARGRPPPAGEDASRAGREVVILFTMPPRFAVGGKVACL